MKTYLKLFILFLALGFANSAMGQPRIWVYPLTLDLPLHCVEEIEWCVDIGNSGDETLLFDINVVYNRGADWLTIEPVQGRIEPGEDGAFFVSTDRGILQRLDPGEYIANIYVKNNDPDNDSVLVQCFIPVIWHPFPIELLEGWNLISCPYLVQREENRDQIPYIFEVGFADRPHELLLVKDGIGRFYAPAYNFNNIPVWNFREGYLVKMAEANYISIDGIQAAGSDTPIPLLEGWNMIAYFPEEEVEATDAFRNIGEALIIAKDGFGNFYNPARDFNNMPPLRRGQGYQVMVTQDIDLIWFIP